MEKMNQAKIIGEKNVMKNESFDKLHHGKSRIQLIQIRMIKNVEKNVILKKCKHLNDVKSC